MQKLPQLLTGFSSQDWKEYHTFTKSRYTKESDLYKIYAYLSKHRKQHNFQKMTNALIAERLGYELPKKSFDNIISRLCNHIEAYFIWSEANRMPNKNHLLISALKRRSIYDQFDKKVEFAIKNMDPTFDQSYDSPQIKQNLFHSFYFSESLSKNIRGAEFLKECIDGFTHYISRTAKYYRLELISRKIIVNEDWDAELERMKLLETTSDEYTKILDDLISLQLNEDDELFNTIYQIDLTGRFDDSTQEIIIVHLTNYIWRQIRKRNYTNMQKLLSLYEKDLQMKYSSDDAIIPFVRFHNIVDTACNLKDHNWVRNFILHYHTKVENNIVESTKKLSTAQLEFSLNNFENVIDILSDTKYKNFPQEARSKSLHIQSYYELYGDNYYFMKSQTDSFFRYMKRHKKNLGKPMYYSFYNLAIYIQKLCKNNNLNSVLEESKNEKYLIFRTWVEQKLNEKIKLKSK